MLGLFRSIFSKIFGWFWRGRKNDLPVSCVTEGALDAPSFKARGRGAEVNFGPVERPLELLRVTKFVASKRGLRFERDLKGCFLKQREVQAARTIRRYWRAHKWRKLNRWIRFQLGSSNYWSKSIHDVPPMSTTEFRVQLEEIQQARAKAEAELDRIWVQNQRIYHEEKRAPFLPLAFSQYMDLFPYPSKDDLARLSKLMPGMELVAENNRRADNVLSYHDHSWWVRIPQSKRAVNERLAGVASLEGETIPAILARAPPVLFRCRELRSDLFIAQGLKLKMPNKFTPGLWQFKRDLLSSPDVWEIVGYTDTWYGSYIVSVAQGRNYLAPSKIVPQELRLTKPGVNDIDPPFVGPLSDPGALSGVVKTPPSGRQPSTSQDIQGGGSPLVDKVQRKNGGSSKQKPSKAPLPDETPVKLALSRSPDIKGKGKTPAVSGGSRPDVGFIRGCTVHQLEDPHAPIALKSPNGELQVLEDEPLPTNVGEVIDDEIANFRAEVATGLSPVASEVVASSWFPQFGALTEGDLGPIADEVVLLKRACPTGKHNKPHLVGCDCI